MKAIQVYEPALCCSTGVCGVDVEQALVDFSADVDWAARHGARIERFNLAQQPMAFADHPLVKRLLETSGEQMLPVTLVDGEVAVTGHYPTRAELASWLVINDQPSIFTEQVAELIAIGAAIASNCKPCLRFHCTRARKLGVTDADMVRAINLAQKVKDTPARSILDVAREILEASDEIAPMGGDKGSDSPPGKKGGCCAPAAAPEVASTHENA